MKTFKLHLVRHGLTQGNIDGIYMGGGLDMPLSAQGVDGLRALAGRFGYPVVDTLFASPMQRALQSAEILFPAARDKNILEELRECRFGEFEGLKVAQLMEDERFTRWLDPKSGFVPAGGESGAQFAARCVAALHAMLEHQMKNGIAEAACVTHGGVIMSMLSQMGLPRKAPAQWMTDNGAGFTVQTSTAMLMRDHMVEAVAVVPAGYLD